MGSEQPPAGLLTSYNIDYVLKVSPANDGESWRELRYVTAPGPIPVGPGVKTLPSWATKDMVFEMLPTFRDDELMVNFTSLVDGNPVMGVFQNKDEVGNFVVMLPPDDAVQNNELFKLDVAYDDFYQKQKTEK